MHLLLTTSHSFLLVDTNTGEFYPLDRGHGLYYGIARNDDKIYVAARNRLVSADIDQRNECGEILIFNNSLQLCGSLHAPFPLRDVHEIAWHGGNLWVTCSFDNMIALYNGECWERWFPLGESATEPYNVNHFNSLMFDQNHIWILAHNRGASELLAFSLETRSLAQRVMLGYCGHNIWQEDDQLFTCSSAEGKLLGERGFLLETPGFPRGVTFDGNSRCVGISALAERNERDFTTGKLMIFDMGWKLQKEIDLPGEGLILDMLPLPKGFRHDAKGSRREASAWSKLARFFKLVLPEIRRPNNP